MPIYNKIAVCEPSDLIYEGIATILSQLDCQLTITRIEDVQDLLKTEDCTFNVELLIVNPNQRKLGNKFRTKLQQKYPDIKTVAMLSSLTDMRDLETFAAYFNIYDSEQDIRKIITNLFSKKNEDKTTDEMLSERETEVLIKIIHGLSNKEIAEELNISIHTVITHRKNITNKTGVKSQAGLVIYAISKNIVAIDDF